MESVTGPNQGNGNIGGIVTTGVKSTSSGNPVANAEVILRSGSALPQKIYIYQ